VALTFRGGGNGGGPRGRETTVLLVCLGVGRRLLRVEFRDLGNRDGSPGWRYFLEAAMALHARDERDFVHEIAGLGLLVRSTHMDEVDVIGRRLM
jgi:hypothetical protein